MDNRRLGKDYKIAVADSFALNKSEKKLIDVINQRLGIVVSANQINDLRKIVDKCCEKYNYTPDDYLAELQSANINSIIFGELVASITVGETYFFRDKKQMDLLKNFILPNIISKKRANNNLFIRIWSAGCASGEELYTIIIMLYELLPDIDNWKLSLLGTDINTVVLQKALNGIYTQWSMRSILDTHKAKWFELKGNFYYLNKNVIDKAHFAYLNLIEDNYPTMISGTNAQDLIICRNVLIYFDEEHATEIMKKLSRSLMEDGYLLLGASDPINYAHTNLILLEEYGKLFSTSVKIKKQVEARIEPLPEENKLKEVILIKKTPVITHIDPKIELDRSVQESNWENVISIINNMPEIARNTAEFLNLKAISLANLGQLEAAMLCCENSIKTDSLKIDTYFTYAMVLIELDQPEQAEVMLRKTLYLDINFVLGHYKLGLLLIHHNKVDAGIKSLTNALSIAKQKPFQEKIPSSAELTYGKLAVILSEEISLYAKSRRDDEKN
jgi:chemotaxis protein methyltransferase CheR